MLKNISFTYWRSKELFDKYRNINEIAYSLGFEYPQYFNKLFKQKTGNQWHIET
jgi:AraC-like DNA-binding protein